MLHSSTNLVVNSLTCFCMKPWMTSLSKTESYQWRWPGSSFSLSRLEFRVIEIIDRVHGVYSRIEGLQCADQLPGMPRRDIFIIAADEGLGKMDVPTESAHPWTARIGTPTTFDKNKSLSSGVRDDSRIELRAGSTKCRALCHRVRRCGLRR